MPVFRIEVTYKDGVKDVPGERLKDKVIKDLGCDISSARVVNVYTIEAGLEPKVLDILKTDAFVDPIIQVARLNEPTPMHGQWVIEVGFRPGVTDNIGRTAKEVIEALSGYRFSLDEGVYTSKMYFLEGILDEAKVIEIAERMLANTLIQRYLYKDASTYEIEGGMGLYVPKVSFEHESIVEVIDITKDIEDLMVINRERTWALSKEELMAIKQYFLQKEVLEDRNGVGIGAMPTDVEMETLAQTWSEHCKHKIFNALIAYEEDGKLLNIESLFKTYIVGSTELIRKRKGKRDHCLSIFKDNAGVIKFNKGYSLAFKVETHNTPSALDPYGGALTGIVGVNRDPFGTGKGARLIFNTDVFCFAPPDYQGTVPPRLFHPKRVLEGVREGVEHGGNKSGIPTINGSVLFDEGYLGKPLVYCGTCGIMPRKIKGEPTHIKQARVGDMIVMVGGRIGKDGIHGATFSSEELSEQSPTSAVQIGDPITQKRMTDFLLKARDLGLYNSITDNGAGGLSSSIGEMAQDTNGCIVHLERAPLKYKGLSPWEILLSEAQERMTVAVSPENIERFIALSERMGVESTVLGEFTDTGKFHVLYDGRTVAYIDMGFLHNGLPRMRLSAKWERQIRDEEPLEEPKDYVKVLTMLLGRWNICSKEYIVRQYDHEVQGGSVIKPMAGSLDDGPSDGSVIRPDLNTMEGIVASHGICPKYSAFDTYHMAACAIDEAIRNNIATGGSLEGMALLDNFCWSDPVESEKNPEGPYKLAQLVRANMAIYDYTLLFGTPCISGKDSMKNDYIYRDIKISIPQTLLISAISIIKDVRKAVTIDFKAPRDLIIIIGTTYPELGGSEYFAAFDRKGNIPPKVRGAIARRIYLSMQRAMKAGIISSCHDVSDGGIGCALAESAFAGGYGAEIGLASVPAKAIFRDDFLLFSESQSRFVVTIKEKDISHFQNIFKHCPYGIIGKVRSDERFIIKGTNGTVIIDIDYQTLKAAWQSPFKTHFNNLS